MHGLTESEANAVKFAEKLVSSEYAGAMLEELEESADIDPEISDTVKGVVMGQYTAAL